MMDKLEELLKLQRELQLAIPPVGRQPGDIEDPEERSDFFRTQVFALEDELHEAADEISWKPWATAAFLNREAYLSELVDALHFWLNLCLLVNASADEIMTAYRLKNQKNHDRQQDGYDGVTGKCPKCRRDLKDAGVKCFAPNSSTKGYCSQTKEIYG